MNRRPGFISDPNRQAGFAATEFAIVGSVVAMALLGVLEMGRLFFALDSLAEATRRGARVAAICPVNHSAIKRIAIFNNDTEGGDSVILHGISEANVSLDYLDIDGVAIADPAAAFSDIRYVRTRIVNYTHQLLIPFGNWSVNAPEFETVLPRESLGVIRDGATRCFNRAS